MLPSAEKPARVLVTGASRGMGLAFARHYAERGDEVVAACRKPASADQLADLASANPGRVELRTLNLSSQESIAALATGLADRGLRFDLVLNNAGISEEEAFGGWTADHFAKHFLVNTTGPALVAQAFAPLMRRGSVIVNISSGMGSLEGNLQPTGPLDAYAASKAALNLLTRRLAAKLFPQGVTVAAINPGWVQTDMGGPDAPDTAQEAAARIATTIEQLTPNGDGWFFEANGERAAF